MGGLSFAAAVKEFSSLQKQIENAHGSIEPWLKMRKNVVAGQIPTFAAVAINGLVSTLRAIVGNLTGEMALRSFLFWMGPLNFLMAVLGVLYLVAWFFQQAVMQNFLSSCWGYSRAKDLSSISFDDQQSELNWLYEIIYMPRVSYESVTQSPVWSFLVIGIPLRFINHLTIDLPGAEPTGVRLDLSIIGDHWLRSSCCEWIPYEQGQGLRLSGPFKTVPNLFGSPPRTVSLRIRYRLPLTSIVGALSFIEWSKPLPPEQWAKRSPELELAIAAREAELAASAP
ncbi:hypothetical protein ACIQYF_16540 [Pseudomonas sp. NPDC096917]|uniref:hypothetical protein n=1 Tax=Pseudomonas sp. NPDC096917 TaxID=3364483 RepID=UPI00383A188B